MDSYCHRPFFEMVTVIFKFKFIAFGTVVALTFVTIAKAAFDLITFTLVTIS